MAAMPMTQITVNANITSGVVDNAGAIYVDLPNGDSADLHETAPLAHPYGDQQAMANLE